MIKARNQNSYINPSREIYRTIKECLGDDFFKLSSPRIALLGGTFDPPQIGHKELARALAKIVDIVIILPTARNPLKANGPIASDQDRLSMLSELMGDLERVRVCSYDIDRVLSGKGEPYTYQLIRDAKEQIPSNASIFLPIGSDCLPDLNLWRNFEELLKSAVVTPINRAGFSIDWNLIESKLGVGTATTLKARLLNLNIPQASSTEVRQALKDGGDLNHLLMPSVQDYIEQHKLYVDKT